MKPLALRNMTRQQRIYNYRLSRARRIVENAFGILASRFRCLLTTMPTKTNTVESLVLACCCLHNLMRIRYPTTQNNMLDHEDPVTHQVNPGAWRDAGEIPEMPPHRIEGNCARVPNYTDCTWWNMSTQRKEVSHGKTI